MEIGTTVEAGGSSYTLNEVKDPAPAGVFGVDAGKRLVALDITQVGISDDGDPYNPLYFAVQDTDGYVYVPGFADADVEPSFGSGELAAGQIVRGWVVFELPESARLVSVLADPEVFGAKVTITDLAQDQGGNIVSHNPPPVPSPPSSPVEIGTTVEAGGSSYTLNEVKDPAPAGVFGVDAGERLVALDITQVGISDDGDPYNPLYFAVQDTDGYVYVPGFADADVEPSFGSGELAAGQIVRGWVVFELPESARLVSVLADPEVFGAKVTITDLAQDQGGNIVSHNPPPVPSPPSSPVEIGTTVEAGGSSYTLNEVKDPAPAGVFGVDAGKRLVALDITQVGISDDGDPYNPLYFAVQDTDGYVYVPGFADADVEPSFGSGELAAGQIVRGWVVFELPESARLVSVLADPEVFGAKITIADLGTVSVVGPAQATTQLSITVSIVPGELPQYDRDDWRHWIDADDDCQDTRHEVLIGESQAAVTYKSDRQCKVEAGQWFGAFTATTVTEASKLDIDHLVPLANAHRSGGWAWAAKRKQQYANSLDNPDHLIAVTASANRSKGAKGPDEWRPPNESYWCDYAVSWIGVKQTWELTVTPAEAGALQDMLETCASPPHLTITETDAASGPANPTPTPMAGDTYASCDEADEAGEQRVQGSKGPGRGFPQSKVPSARDGDGDGVVCEK